MESINTHKIKYKFIAILMAFVIAIAPFGSMQKVKANTIEDTLKFGIPVVALILAALTSNGAISGGYQVSPADLSSITEKAQTNLQAAGSAAIDQANKLGEAIKSGAESAKIKALASGAVIYAFLQAIQDVLFQHDTSVSMESLPDYNYIGNMSGCQIYVNAKDFPSNFALGPREHYDDTQFKQYITFPSLKVQGDRWMMYEVYAYNTETNLYWAGALGWVTRNDRYKFCASGNACKVVDNKYAIIALLPNVPLNYHGTEAEKIASAPSVTIPTVLPSSVSDSITNWDGTSDLVLSPPLPYDIPDDEALVVDPTYGGEVIDPTDPVDPPAEEGTIVLPWLAALLGLLGLGNPSLEGIEAGVKTAIDKLIEGITATAQDVFDGSKEIFGNITDALTGIDAGIQSGIDALTGSISVPLANIADFALSVPDFFAIPEGKSIATPIIEQIPTVFPIVDQMNTALNKITVQTRPLIIYYPYLDGSTKEINLNWYEPAREQVKHGVGLLFKVVTALACFAMVSNVFGIGIRVGAGQAYTDNNSGGGNSRKKED